MSICAKCIILSLIFSYFASGFFSPCFTDEESEAQRIMGFSKITQLKSDSLDLGLCYSKS